MSEEELRELTNILFDFYDKMRNTEKLREYIKTIYVLYDDTVKKYDSRKTRVKYSKDICPYLEPRLKKLGITELDGQRLHRASYIILKITESIDEDPRKPREFTSIKTKWDEVYTNIDCHIDKILDIMLKH